ncbi:hypothetical protein BDW02DRAFT_540248 [Decorospora gaudefroyi]|uniref:Mitochondrial export translocase Oxa2 n=1 Tax=Decorospora gaudefroyi TaxID=184978 RepID=A0A6A5KSS2_9PLEO|nr:hypothetical protein BDW02DRAFT_540248 [Decorospora gaudefroyi]
MLSSRLLRQPTCQLRSRGFQKPQAATCRPSARAFHASAPRQDPLLDAIVYWPHEMMSMIHAHVPWYAALPLTAFITRGLLVVTAGSWARAIMARYVGLHPLRQALAFQKQHEILRKGNFGSLKEASIAVRKEAREVTNALDKRWNVSLVGQVGWTLGQIPIFFAMAEAIRQKCGARDGLLGIAFSAFKSEDATATIGQLSPSKWLEPSLATEGMLWFQNLLIPDPTGALPYIVGGLMFTNVYTSKNTVNNTSKWPGVLRRSILFICLLVGPLCQGVPAALMLYWGASTSSVMLWNVWLDWKHPAPRGYTACARPLLMPPTPRGRKV